MHKKQFRKEIIILVIAVIVLLIIGAFIFVWLEKWTFVNAFYFVAMTATTVGYGDLTPTHTLSKIITIIYALSIIPFVVYTFSAVARYNTERIYRTVRGVERKQDEQEEEMEKAEKKLAENRRRLLEQEEEMKQQERRVKKQMKLNRQYEMDIEKHKKELEDHQRKIHKQMKVAEVQEEEIQEHDKELEVVENIVEGELEREKKKKTK
jgi:flagellar biosynthesis GTPase FlhF